jgi:hypothetical protein
MYLLIISTADVGDSADSKELDVERLAFDKDKPAVMSETVRAKFNLSAAHRGKIEEWLRDAKLGDTLLLNVKERRVRGQPSDLMTDDVALVVAPYTPIPVVSRLVLKEVVTTEAALQSLPSNAKRITRASKKSKK